MRVRQGYRFKVSTIANSDSIRNIVSQRHNIVNNEKTHYQTCCENKRLLHFHREILNDVPRQNLQKITRRIQTINKKKLNITFLML